MKIAAMALAVGLAGCAPAVLKAPGYTVDKSDPDWLVVFRTAGVVRVHLKCDSGPHAYVSTEVRPGRPFHVKPGQWLEWVAPKFMSAVIVPLPNLRNC